MNDAGSIYLWTMRLKVLTMPSWLFSVNMVRRNPQR